MPTEYSTKEIDDLTVQLIILDCDGKMNTEEFTAQLAKRDELLRAHADSLGITIQKLNQFRLGIIRK